MKIVYIADEPIVKEKKLTKKQKLHNEAIASIAARRVHDRLRAQKMFQSKFEELEKLEAKLNIRG